MPRTRGGQEGKAVDHDGDCGNHAKGRSFAHKAINQGYYWPKMFTATKEHVR